MRQALLLIASLSLLALPACKETPAPAAAPAKAAAAALPTEPLALRRALLAEVPGAMEKTTCACCNKALAQCFRETLSGEGQRCPVGCANCLVQGRVAHAVKRAGGSDEEAATRSFRVAKGLEAPPAGVSLDMGAHTDHTGHSH